MAEVKDASPIVREKPLDTSNRDAIAEGIVGLLKPCVIEIDERVKCVRYL